jgi:hypothetical protein
VHLPHFSAQEGGLSWKTRRGEGPGRADLIAVGLRTGAPTRELFSVLSFCSCVNVSVDAHIAPRVPRADGLTGANIADAIEIQTEGVEGVHRLVLPGANSPTEE